MHQAGAAGTAPGLRSRRGCGKGWGAGCGQDWGGFWSLIFRKIPMLQQETCWSKRSALWLVYVSNLERVAQRSAVLLRRLQRLTSWCVVIESATADQSRSRFHLSLTICYKLGEILWNETASNFHDALTVLKPLRGTTCNQFWRVNTSPFDENNPTKYRSQELFGFGLRIWVKGELFKFVRIFEYVN